MWSYLLLALLLGAASGLEEPPRTAPPGPLDRVEVVSSALRILPRRRERRSSQAAWRKPRDYEFVTRDGARSPRRLPYPEEENYPTQDYNERRRDYPNRRIIYYASLPEVIRRPGEWTPPRPIYYPPPSQNEIVTRVHSGLIDVTSPSKYGPVDRYGSEELPPRFTIIDAEPPYDRPRPPPRDYHRYDYRSHDYNRFDYRNHVEPPPYRAGYYDPLPPFHRQQLPAQPVTVVRRPLESGGGRPLDVRPLDLVRLHPLSTQAPPPPSTPSTTTSTTTTSTQPPPAAAQQEIATFQRAASKS